MEEMHRNKKKKDDWNMKLEDTCNQMHIEITGIKIMKTCQATCDITAIIPKSCINENAKDPT